MIQSINYVFQDMSVPDRCLVPCANQVLVQNTAEILKDLSKWREISFVHGLET